MSRPSKEAKERAFFQRFKKAVSELEGYSVAEQESPDFLLTSEQKVIGIEIRQLLLSGDLKARESLENRIVAAARERYEKENLPPLQVTFQFKSRLSISKHEQQDVGNAAGNVIAQKIRKGGEVGEIKAGLPEGIESIIYAELKEGADPVWGPFRTGFIPEVPSDEIQTAIDDKHSKISDYRTEADRVWLVLCVEGFQPSTMWDVSGPALNQTYRSSFDRVYLLDYQDVEAFQLSIEEGA